MELPIAMRLIYMGTPHFAVLPLRALVSAGHDIAAVITRTDKPSGRGKVLAAPAVKIAASELGLSVFQPKRVREPEFIQQLRLLAPDVIVVAAYGQILPKEILTLPRYGCINIHASLLPRYRGAAPANWAIIRGEKETGITIMEMDEGLDTGAILLQEHVEIEDRDTTGTLLEKLSVLGSNMIVEALSLLATGGLVPRPQDNALATLAPLLKKEEGLIDWTLPATEIHNRVRGLSPWPSAYTFLEGKLMKILSTEVIDGEGEPGKLYEKSKDVLEVGTEKGRLQLLIVQPEGKKPMTAGDFMRGHRVGGKKFEAGTSQS